MASAPSRQDGEAGAEVVGMCRAERPTGLDVREASSESEGGPVYEAVAKHIVIMLMYLLYLLFRFCVCVCMLLSCVCMLLFVFCVLCFVPTGDLGDGHEASA